MATKAKSERKSRNATSVKATSPSLRLSPRPKLKPKPKPKVEDFDLTAAPLLGPWVALFEQLTSHQRRVVVFRGKVRFPAGGAAKWRAKTPKYREESVGVTLDRFALSVEEGSRWLDVRVTRDEVTILGWDWRFDWEKLAHSLCGVLEAGAFLSPVGKVEIFAREDGGSCRWISYTFVGKKLDIDDGDATWDGKKMQVALNSVGPAFRAWLDAHPRVKERYDHAGSYGYVDRTGREVVAPRLQRAYEFSEGLAGVQDKTGHRILGVDGKLLSGKFASVDYCLRGKMPVSIRHEKFGYVDRTGKLCIPAKFAAAKPFHGPLAIVHVGPSFHHRTQRWLSPDGELVGDPFDYTPGFSEDLAWVYRRDLETYGCIDAKGRPAFEKRFASAGLYGDGLAAVRELGSSMKFGYADRDGNMVIDQLFEEAHPFVSGRAVVRDGKAFWLIDRKGKRLGETFDGVTMPSVSEGMLAVSKRGRMGFVDENGKMVIPPKFVEAYGFFEGLAYVSVKQERGEPLWGHVGRDGKFVVAPTLEWTNCFVDGLAPAKSGGLYGFIGRDGAWVIGPQYRSMQPGFSDGLAWFSLP